MSQSAVVIGAGVFGIPTALELRRRGWAVTLLDPGPIPHPLAASTDISKVIRIEYGPDVSYMRLAEAAREGWLKWNEEWSRTGGDSLYHETGVLMISRAAMEPGGFEAESFARLLGRGHEPERITARLLCARFPAWELSGYTDGFYHAKGGYAESGRVIQALALRAVREGVVVGEGSGVVRLIERGTRVTGVEDAAGRQFLADEVIVAAGVWTAKLVGLPVVCIQPSGHPVIHLRPADPAPFAPDQFPVFTADITRTGCYGFPANRDGIVKVATHRLGIKLDADDRREVDRADIERMRAFLSETLPALADAPVVYTRLCMYADTQDEDFWIARDPARDGLTVASGGSGHGFKFAPVLGGIVADVVEGVAQPWSDKFRWRPEIRMDHGTEAARAHLV